MTKVIKINCRLFWKCLGIITWALASIGIGIGLFINVSYLFEHGLSFCVKPDWPFDVVNFVCYEYFSPMILLASVLAFGSNIINYYIIFSLLNDKYKWFELECKN